MTGEEFLGVIVSGIVLTCVVGLVLGAYALWFIASILREMKQEDQKFKKRRM